MVVIMVNLEDYQFQNTFFQKILKATGKLTDFLKNNLRFPTPVCESGQVYTDYKAIQLSINVGIMINQEDKKSENTFLSNLV